jgi:hypothetical protein
MHEISAVAATSASGIALSRAPLANVEDRAVFLDAYQQARDHRWTSNSRPSRGTGASCCSSWTAI